MKATSKRSRKRSDVPLSRVRSALTNGSTLFLGDVDERLPFCRRLRDLQRAYESDAGGADTLSEAQRTILRRSAMLELQLEIMESRFAANGGEASATQLEIYGRAASTLRRLLESVGLHQGRKTRDVTSHVTLDSLIDAVKQPRPSP